MAHTLLDDLRAGEQVISTTISTSGVVTDGEQSRAVDAVSAALADIDRPVRRCVIRLEHRTDPHHVRRAVARLSVDLDGRRVQSHAEDESVDQAATTAANKLHERLRKLVDKVQDARRHGDRLTSLDEDQRAHVPTVERDDSEREVVARHHQGPPDATLDEAAFDLDALGYRFHVFVDVSSGDDALVRYDESDELVVQFASGPPDTYGQDPVAVSVRLDERPAPELDLVSAREMLHVGEIDHVFFRDTATGRGAILYRRYDGHDGLVSTAS
ncbi:MAG: hypothetical protein AAGF91_15045 [Actinomycetota bacterium]